MLNFVKKHIKEFTHEEGGNSGFFYPDQDLINIVMEDEIKELPLKWNNQYIKNFRVEEAYDQGIVHYIGEEKPWTFSGRKNDFIKIYFDYWNKSGLRRYKVYYGLIALYSDYKDIFQSKIAKIKRLINHNENVNIF